MKGDSQLWDPHSPNSPIFLCVLPSIAGVASPSAEPAHLAMACVAHYFLSTYSPCVSLWGNSFVAAVPRNSQVRTAIVEHCLPSGPSLEPTWALGVSLQH